MQTSFSRKALGGSTASVSHRRTAMLRNVAFTPAKPASSRALSVQVMAKGKGGRRGVAGVPGQMEMIQREPPTPEVDPENAEFVIFVKAKKYMDGKIEVSESKWIPLSIVKGGQAANLLVKACESEWGRKLYSNTLIRNIGLAVYKDRAEIERNIKNSYPPFKTVSSSNFAYAFKIRDKSNPKSWIASEGLTVCPPASKLEGTAQDALANFFSAGNFGAMFSAKAQV